MSEAPNTEEQWGPDYEERACIICDGLGHGYIIDWEQLHLEDNTVCEDTTCIRTHISGRPIVASPCPLEDSAPYDPRDYEESW